MILENLSQNNGNDQQNVSKNITEDSQLKFNGHVKKLIEKYEQISAKNNNFYITRRRTQSEQCLPIEMCDSVKLNRKNVYRFLSLENDRKYEVNNDKSDINNCDINMPSVPKKSSKSNNKISVDELDKEKKPSSVRKKEDIWKILFGDNTRKNYNRSKNETLPNKKKENRKNFARSYSNSDNRIKDRIRTSQDAKNVDNSSHTGAIKKQTNPDDVVYRKRRNSYLMATQTDEDFRKLKIYPENPSYVSKTISKFENSQKQTRNKIEDLLQQYHDNKKFGTSNKLTREELSLEIDNVLCNKYQQISRDSTPDKTVTISGENHNNLQLNINSISPNFDQNTTIISQENNENTRYVIIMHDTTPENADLSLKNQEILNESCEMNIREKLSTELNRVLKTESFENLCENIEKVINNNLSTDVEIKDICVTVEPEEQPIIETLIDKEINNEEPTRRVSNLVNYFSDIISEISETRHSTLNRRLSTSSKQFDDSSPIKNEDSDSPNLSQYYCGSDSSNSSIFGKLFEGKEFPCIKITSIDEELLKEARKFDVNAGNIDEFQNTKRVSSVRITSIDQELFKIAQIDQEIDVLFNNIDPGDRSEVCREDSRNSTQEIDNITNLNTETFSEPIYENLDNFKVLSRSGSFSSFDSKSEKPFHNEASLETNIYENIDDIRNSSDVKESSVKDNKILPETDKISVQEQMLKELSKSGSFSSFDSEKPFDNEASLKANIYENINDIRNSSDVKESSEYIPVNNEKILPETVKLLDQKQMLKEELEVKLVLRNESFKSQKDIQENETSTIENKPRFSRLYSGKFSKRNFAKQDTNNNECKDQSKSTISNNNEKQTVETINNEKQAVETINNERQAVETINNERQAVKTMNNGRQAVETINNENQMIEHQINNTENIYDLIKSDNLFYSDSDGDYDCAEAYNEQNPKFLNIEKRINTSDWVQSTVKLQQNESYDKFDYEDDGEHLYERIKRSGSSGTLCTIYDEQKNPIIRMSTLEAEYVEIFDIEESEKELRRSINEMQDNSKKACLINELITTEKSYINQSLHRIVLDYMPEMNKANIPKGLMGKSRQIFGNADLLYEEHKYKFLPDLEKHTNAEELATCFLKHETLFKLYPLYSKNKPKSETVMRDYAHYFKARQEELNDKLDLASYLLTPIQRLAKYCQFVKGIVKECEKESTNGVEKLKSALEMLNKQMRMGNDLIALDSIVGYNGSIREQGEVLLRDNFMVQPPNKRLPYEGMIFLFQKCLIITAVNRQDYKETFVFKESFQLTDMGFTDNDSEPLEFSVWFRKRDNNNYRFRTKNHDIKQKWVKEIFNLLWKQLEANKRRREKELEEKGVKDTRVPVVRPYSVPNKGKDSPSSTKSKRKHTMNSSSSTDTIWYCNQNTRP